MATLNVELERSPRRLVGRRATASIGKKFWIANVVALLAVAVWLRIDHLGNIPGINGDEAWSGVQAMRWLHGQTVSWRTPTGNPVNVFFLVPQIGLHWSFGPSFTLLRSVAVASGILTLVANYALCRKAFDARTAAISTVLLAILPIDIAYSRFAWDASQSVLATSLVMYLALLHLADSKSAHLVSIPGTLALAAAIIVHPTNLFALPLLLVPAIYKRREQVLSLLQNTAISARPSMLVVLLAASALVAYAAWLALAGEHGHPLREAPAFAANYLRLLSGATVFEYISGAPLGSSNASWAAWLSPFCNLLFAALVVLALWGLVHRLVEGSGIADRCLGLSWLVMLVGFFVVAGPGSIAPHFERYGMCLIAPAALLVSRGLAWWWESRRRGWVDAVLAGGAWLWLAAFYLGYFVFIEQTGGAAHRTFRTAEVEPKLAAFQFVRSHSEPDRPLCIVCDEWWNYWPVAYLASNDPRVRVELPGDPNDALGISSRGNGCAWFVGFAGGEAQRVALASFAHDGMKTREKTIRDYGGRAILSVIGRAENLSQNY